MHGSYTLQESAYFGYFNPTTEWRDAKCNCFCYSRLLFGWHTGWRMTKFALWLLIKTWLNCYNYQFYWGWSTATLPVNASLFNCVTVRWPGKRQKSSWLDMLICYLSWAKLGIDYIQLAMHFGNDITLSQVEENICRIRPVLKDSLSKKWFDLVPARLRPLAESPFPQVALIVDSHTPPCFCQRPLLKKPQFTMAKTKFMDLNWK